MRSKRLRSDLPRISLTSFPKKNFPNVNHLDFGNLSYLESKVSATHHQILEALKVKLQKEWAKVLQKVIRDTCKAFPKRLQLVIAADGGHIE